MKRLAVFVTALFMIYAASFAVAGNRCCTPMVTPQADPDVLYPIGAATGFGYIDKTGAVVVKPLLDLANQFCEGMALVKSRDDEYFFINHTGKKAFALEFTPEPRGCNGYSDGLAAVRQNDIPGFIDKTGKFVIAPQFDSVGNFNNGRAFVTNDLKNYYIDRSGKKVFDAPEGCSSNFSEGMLACSSGTKAGQGYLDTSGSWVLQPKYDATRQFTEGLAFVKLKYPNAREYGIIDKTGKLVAEPRFFYVLPFSEGLAFVKYYENTKEVHGYVDHSGAVVLKLAIDIEGVFNDSSFSDGLALVKVKDKGYNQYKYGYIDKTGKFVIPPQFASAEPFYAGMALVEFKDSGRAYIDKTGKTVWSRKK